MYQDLPELVNDTKALKSSLPYLGEVMLGHVRYGTFEYLRVVHFYYSLVYKNYNCIVMLQFYVVLSKKIAGEMYLLILP